MIHAAAQRAVTAAIWAGALGQVGGGSNQDLVRYLMWIGLALALLVLAGAGVMVLRKRIFRGESEIDAAGSMFDELRRLHHEGLMSREEYDAARKKLAARASEAMDRRAAGRAAGRAAEKPGDKYGPRGSGRGP